jgi:hypothetical protein
MAKACKAPKGPKADFSPVDLSDIGLAFPLPEQQWLEYCRPQLPAIRMALKVLQMKKEKMSGMANVVGGRAAGEEIVDHMDAAVKWLRGLAQVVEVAEIRVLDATRYFVEKKVTAD